MVAGRVVILPATGPEDQLWTTRNLLEESLALA